MLVQVGRGRGKQQSLSQSTTAHALSPELRLVLRCLDANRILSTPIGENIVVVGRGYEGFAPPIDLEPLGGMTQGVSRRHAVFTLHEGELYVEDLNSTNGTRINGFRIAPLRNYRLRNGDEIEFGTIRLTVSLLRIPSR
ncbi:MAG: FHA domain-containing protein [Anaerolineae bacterium]|nr:FHA domain-containing protein [Anaerolineae bacterium]NUQ03124.1 FHA domain-containing protein [Anaerolineae bacterium]